MCRSFTHALGIPICAKLTPWVEGTLEFFEEGGDSKKPLLVTARHAIFHQTDNEPFERKLVSQMCSSSVEHHFSSSSSSLMTISIRKITPSGTRVGVSSRLRGRTYPGPYHLLPIVLSADLDTQYAPQVLTTMMHSNPKNRYRFAFHGNRFLSLRGTILDT